MKCRACKTSKISLLRDFMAMKRVTSDCKPWESGAKLYFCHRCGCISQQADDQWRQDCNKIYRRYKTYLQSNGQEQKSVSKEGKFIFRSKILASFISQSVDLDKTGKLLDFGCGNGAFLKEWHNRKKNWNLFGLEISPKNIKSIKASLPYVNIFSNINDLSEKSFNLVTCIHVLEHLEKPSEFLQKLKSLMAMNGSLFIQVPYFKRNPMELLTVDHASHFSILSLRLLLESNGWKVIKCCNEPIQKEISCVAVPGEKNQINNSKKVFLQPKIGLKLNAIINKLISKIGRRKYCLFGSAITACWLALNFRAPCFFVDEDKNRLGKKFLKRKIISLREFSKLKIPLVIVNNRKKIIEIQNKFRRIKICKV